MTKIEMQCETCNKTFYRTIGKIGKSIHHFCCCDCYYKYRLEHPYKYKNERYSRQLQMLLDYAEKKKVGTKGK